MILVRGTGLLPDDPELVRAENASCPLTVLTGMAKRPKDFDRRGLIDRIIDQGWTNSCVGCAIATAIFLRGQASGKPVRRPSAKLIYDQARLAGGDVPELIDWGCRPHDAIEAARRHGLVPEVSWPLFTDDPNMLALAPRGTTWINTKPDFTTYHEAADSVMTGYFRADTGDIIGALEGAIALDYFPVFGMLVEPRFGRVVGDELYDAPGRVEDYPGLPGHMQAICGYDEEAFLVVSSWGESHGNRGIVRVAKRFLAGPWSYARMVITSAPASLAP